MCCVLVGLACTRIIFFATYADTRCSSHVLILFGRYVVQLLTPCSILAKTNGKDNVEADDVQEMHELFLDAKTSAKMLATSGAKYLM